MGVFGSQARLMGRSIKAIHGIGQNPGIVENERVLFEAILETDGDDFQIGLDLQLGVALEGYELPIVDLLL
jgi:hypothetical protein